MLLALVCALNLSYPLELKLTEVHDGAWWKQTFQTKTSSENVPLPRVIQNPFHMTEIFFWVQRFCSMWRTVTVFSVAYCKGVYGCPRIASKQAWCGHPIVHQHMKMELVCVQLMRCLLQPSQKQHLLALLQANASVKLWVIWPIKLSRNVDRLSSGSFYLTPDCLHSNCILWVNVIQSWKVFPLNKVASFAEEAILLSELILPGLDQLNILVSFHYFQIGWSNTIIFSQ